MGGRPAGMAGNAGEGRVLERRGVGGGGGVGKGREEGWREVGAGWMGVKGGGGRAEGRGR